MDGFYITHDMLFGNGIKVREGDRGAFKLGFMEKLDIELHRSGTASTDAVTGLDGLITTAPTTGVVGGIDPATFAYWRNNASTAIASTTAGTLATAMEAQWRTCTMSTMMTRASKTSSIKCIRNWQYSCAKQ